MKKRVLAMLLGVCMLTSLFVGCDKTPTQNPEPSQSETEKPGSEAPNPDTEDENAAPAIVDLKGEKIVIYQTGNTFTPDPTTSKMAAAQAKMIEQLQTEFNCEFDIKTVGNDELLSLAVSANAGESAIGHIIVLPVYDSGKYIGSGIVEDLNTISTIDLSKKYMQNAGATDTYTFGGKTYAVADVNGTMTRQYGVYFNKRILEEMGYSTDHLYDLLEKGEWTWDTYRQFAKAATKETDGKAGMTKEDQWGHVVTSPETGVMDHIYAGFGAERIKKGENGELIYNMEDPTVLEALNFAYDLFVKDKTIVSHQDIGDTEAVGIFASGKALFLTARVEKVSEFANMDDEYGLLPMPKKDKDQKNNSSIDWNAEVMMIPTGLTKEQREAAGAIIQRMNYLEQEVAEIYYKELDNMFFLDDQSVKSLSMNTCYITPTHMVAHYDEAILAGTYRVGWSMFSNATPATITDISSAKGPLEIELAEFNEKVAATQAK